jgi:arylsulfatase A-like enzyme
MRRSRLADACAAALVALSLSGTVLAAPPPERAFKHFPARPMPPPDAPNVLLIMTDDVGFSASDAFGGPIPTPTFDALAHRGLRYNEFHTAAMCSATRAALLTGRNHHAVESGAITDLATDEEGYTSVIPKSAATIAQVLHEEGYDTAWVGKNHNTPDWETGPMGPFDRWPNGMGFDYFYGFNAAMTNQLFPALVENRTTLDPPADGPDYNLDQDLSDHLIHWLRMQRTLHTGRPFFAYVAPGTMHNPQQVPGAWLERFKGRFAAGWDKLREETFARQKALGVIPKDARLTPRPPDLPAWDGLSELQRRVYARMMEIAAAQLAHSDAEIGRIIEELRASGQLDNTLVIFIQGDNGASLETFRGAVNGIPILLGIEPSDAELAARLADVGGPNSFGQYPAAWAWATNTPFQWGKQVASHLGGLRDGLVISWPARIRSVDEMRSQFHHVIDIAPTIYEACGVDPPALVNGVTQQPIDGTSMVYTFDHPREPSRRHEQYFEMLGNRAYYKDGWMASSLPPDPPWEHKPAPAPAVWHWALYDLSRDYSQSTDLAARNPAKLAELQQDFDRAAVLYHVYPLQADFLKRTAAGTRPGNVEGRRSFVYYAGTTRYPRTDIPAMRPGWRIAARISVQVSSMSGPLYVQGDQFSGATLAMQDGRPVFIYDPTGRPDEEVRLAGDEPLRPGEHLLEAVSAPAGEGPRSATWTLRIDGQERGAARVPTLYPILWGAAYFGRPGLGRIVRDEAPRPLAGGALETAEISVP